VREDGNCFPLMMMNSTKVMVVVCVVDGDDDDGDSSVSSANQMQKLLKKKHFDLNTKKFDPIFLFITTNHFSTFDCEPIERVLLSQCHSQRTERANERRAGERERERKELSHFLGVVQHRLAYAQLCVSCCLSFSIAIESVVIRRAHYTKQHNAQQTCTCQLILSTINEIKKTN
jgi:hypothetical protein